MIGKTCVKCRVELRPKENDVLAVSRDIAGNAHEIYCADLWHCPSCEVEMLLGFGHNPIEAGLDNCDQFLIANANREKPQATFDCWLNQHERIAANDEHCQSSRCDSLKGDEGGCKNAATPMHSCPWEVEVNDFHGTFCNCCEKCMRECRHDT